MKRLVGALLALTLAGGAAPALAQNAPPGARPPGPGGPPQQAGGTIRGTIVDAATGRAVSSAQVAVWSAADSALVTGAVVRADGAFRVEGLRPGRYYLRVSSLGYETATTGVLAVAPGAAAPVDAGTVRLAQGAVQLDALDVSTERATVAMAPDRNTYTTRDLPSAAGGTATDVLRNVPSIEVDGDGKVSLRGNQNVAVQINGRPAPMQGEQLAGFLQQLPASMVERVEVIPNPSAKYDPEGMAGIVNLVLKQNTDLGWSGGTQLGMGTGEKYNASGNLGYQRGPLTLFFNYGFNADKRETTGFNDRENLPFGGAPRSFFEQDILGAFDAVSHSLNSTADLKVGRQNTLSGSLLLSRRDFEAQTRNFYRRLDADGALFGRFDQRGTNEHADATVDAALAFKRVLEPQRHELSAELRLNRSDNTLLNDFEELQLALDGGATAIPPSLTLRELDALATQWTLQADYTRPLGGRSKLETGYKGTLRGLDNDVAVDTFAYDPDGWVRDLGQTNAFEYDEKVHAGYAVLHHGIGRVDLQAGLRLEQTDREFYLANNDSTYPTDYLSAFPSALAAWNVSDTRQVKASYSRRIQRPDSRLLNPFPFFEDRQNQIRGNPLLEPEYTDAFELGFQQSMPWGSLQLSPFYRHTTGAIRRVKTVENDLSTVTFKNLDQSDSYGADMTGSWRLGQSLNGFASVNAFRMVSEGGSADGDLSADAFGWSARVSANWKVTPRLDVQAMHMYRAPMDVEAGRISGFQMTNLSVRQKLMGERASVSLRVMDPFNRMGFGFRTFDDTHEQVSERKFGARAAYITFSYNFGRPPRIQPRPQQQPEPQPGGDIGIN
ncbi:MAG TPA: TonB-dependent receptor [Longimicrobium sp.]|nr:TonB-dependent receptor [Longimicrobium sp.]